MALLILESRHDSVEGFCLVKSACQVSREDQYALIRALSLLRSNFVSVMVLHLSGLL